MVNQTNMKVAKLCRPQNFMEIIASLWPVWPLRPARPSERFLSTIFESLDGFSLTFCKNFSSFNICPSWVRRVGCCGTPSFGIWLHCSETSKERSTSWRPLWSQAEEVATSVDRERLLEGCGPFPAVHPMSDTWMSKENKRKGAGRSLWTEMFIN